MSTNKYTKSKTMSATSFKGAINCNKIEGCA